MILKTIDDISHYKKLKFEKTVEIESLILLILNTYKN